MSQKKANTIQISSFFEKIYFNVQTTEYQQFSKQKNTWKIKPTLACYYESFFKV